jgi:hypothetical protein
MPKEELDKTSKEELDKMLKEELDKTSVDLNRVSLLLCLTTPLMSYKPVSITYSLRTHLMYI